MLVHPHPDDLISEHAKRVALQHHACDQAERMRLLEQENAELRAAAKARAAHVEALEGFAP